MVRIKLKQLLEQKKIGIKMKGRFHTSVSSEDAAVPHLRVKEDGVTFFDKESKLSLQSRRKLLSLGRLAKSTLCEKQQQKKRSAQVREFLHAAYLLFYVNNVFNSNAESVRLIVSRLVR